MMKGASFLAIGILAACSSTDGIGVPTPNPDAALDHASLDHFADAFDDHLDSGTAEDAPDDANVDGQGCQPTATLSPVVDPGSDCVYDIAALFAADAGHRIDKLAIHLLGCDGGALDLSLVSSATDCGPTPAAFVDSSTSPSTLTLCTATCALAKADCSETVELVFGCSGDPL